MSSVGPLVEYADQPLWVAWQVERPKNRSRPTKPPYSPRGEGRAKSDDPASWGTLDEALQRAAALPKPFGQGGVGVMLAPLATGEHLGGIDLDSCRSQTGDVEPWAQEIIERIASYTEVSPSGTGFKVFFLYDPAAVAEHDLQNKTFTRGKGDHPPAIEFYLGGRYFTVTGQANGISALRIVPPDDLLWVVATAGPAFKGTSRQRDKARDYRTLSIDDLASAYEVMHNDDLSGDEWVARGTALKGMPGDDAAKFDIFDKFSRKSSKYNEVYTRERWDKFKPNGKLSAGSIVHWARESDPTWKPSSHATNLPVVRITGGELPRMVDEAEAALLAMNIDVYQQGPRLVRPVWDEITTAQGKAKALRLSPVQPAHLHERFTEAAYFEKAKSKGSGWELSRVDCPDRIVDAYMGRDGMWKLPRLRGVVTAPTLRPDGSVLDQPGYDEATGILFNPCGVAFPSVPQHPGRDDALRALAVLKAPFRDVPFVGKQDLAVALSGVLTTVIRRALPVAPMHAYTAPTAGSGKSNLVDVASVIASGERAAVTSMGGRGGAGESELEKRLHASYLAGAQIITIDNIESPLGGDFLSQAASQHILKVRVLGRSIDITVPNTPALFATGNNLVIVGDLTRRVVLGSIDAMVERPELRDFDWDMIDYTKEHRAELVVAALTIVRARVVSGDERPKVLGGYREWSRLVRDALVWLGEADPVDTMEKTRSSDPQLDKLKMVIDALHTVFGQHEVTVREMINASKETLSPECDGLRDALLSVAGSDRGDVISEKLSWWLRHNLNRPVKLDPGARDAFRIVKIKGGKYAKWKVEAVGGPLQEEGVQGTLPGVQEEEWQT